MRIVVGKAPLRRILKWAQRALFACAFLLLGYCAFALVDAWIFQSRQSALLDRQLRDRRAASEAAITIKGVTTSFASSLSDLTPRLRAR